MREGAIVLVGKAWYNQPVALSSGFYPTVRYPMAHLSLRLLGVPQAELDDKPLPDLPTDKVRALLYYLAVEGDIPHSREKLAGLLWPDQPEERARQNLRQTLSYLRQALGAAADAVLLVSRDAVQLNASGRPAVDIADYVALLDECRKHPHRRLDGCLACLRRLRRALEIYRGDFLSGFAATDSAALEEWVLLRREWLRRQAIEALAVLARYDERQGNLSAAREYARRQVELEPWHEEAHRQLMRLLAMAGERSAALAQYEACRRTLAAELGIDPTPETVELYNRLQAGRMPAAPPRLHNLPAVWDAFVGREDDLAALAGLLADPACRLVTLSGPGGIGKTRLALAAAAEHVGAFAHGVWFVPLADVAEVGGVASAVAEALGLDTLSREEPRVQVLSYLHDKELLLVLDGMEHLPHAADLLSEIARRAPHVVLLVTSQERLRLREERVYEVAGLAYPETAPASCAAGQYAALDLYAERARQRNRRFALTAELPAVARICRLVEGMPLGLELAAAAGRPAAEVAEEIERDLTVLSTSLRNVPARHASIRAAIDHSWRRLTEAQRGCFARLSVFRGGWTTAAAAAVAASTESDLYELERQSLLLRDPSGRWRIHTLLRQYAEERLAAGPALPLPPGDRHCAYYLDLVERSAAALAAPAPATALETVAADLKNIRQAWHWAVERLRWSAVAGGLEGLARFHQLRGPFQEAAALFSEAAAALAPRVTDAAGRALLARLWAEEARFLDLQGKGAEAVAAAQAAIGHAEAAEAGGIAAARSARALALVLWGQVLVRAGDYAAACERLERAVALAQEAGAPGTEAAGRRNLANVAFFRGDFGAAREGYERALALHRRAGDRYGESALLHNLGGVWYQQGDNLRAQECYAQALAIRKEMGDRWGEGSTLLNLGHLADDEGNAAEAGQYYRQALEIARALGDRRGEGVTLINLGANHTDRGDYAAAIASYEAALLICREVDDRRSLGQALAFLGSACIHCGDYARARSCLNEAAQIFDGIDDPRGRGEVLTHLAQLLAVTAEWAAAQEVAASALQIAETIGDPHIAAYALTSLGHALAGQSRWEDAVAAYGRAQALWAELGLRPRQWEAQAGLARVVLAAGRPAEAQSLAQSVLAALAHDRAAQSAPLRVYLDCSAVLREVGDAGRAEELVARARELLRERAGRIGTPALRRAFLENIAVHREIQRRGE